MTKPIGLREQVKILIAEQPGISSKEIAEFFTELKNHESQVSAALSVLYGEGGYRRERAAGQRSFRYWPDAEAGPQPVVTKARKQTEAGAHAECAILRERIAELEAWQAEALKRFPDLAVAPTIITAREIVAKRLKANGDANGALDVQAGRRDHTPIMQAAVDALEWAA
jgi:hypothetical protein